MFYHKCLYIVACLLDPSQWLVDHIAWQLLQGQHRHHCMQYTANCTVCGECCGVGSACFIHYSLLAIIQGSFMRCSCLMDALPCMRLWWRMCILTVEDLRLGLHNVSPNPITQLFTYSQWRADFWKSVIFLICQTNNGSHPRHTHNTVHLK